MQPYFFFSSAGAEPPSAGAGASAPSAVSPSAGFLPGVGLGARTGFGFLGAFLGIKMYSESVMYDSVLNTLKKLLPRVG